MKVSVRFDGAEKLVSKLGGLARQAKRDALAEAASEGLEPILADARRRVPVRTGALRDSLKIQVWEASEKKVELEVISDPGTAFYGSIVEFDDPFLRPAFDAHKAEAERRVADILAAKIGRVTSGV